MEAPLSTGTLKRAALRRHLPPDATIVEAGAHRGGDTVRLAALFPEGRIHAFEPVPALYEELRAATAACENVTTYPLALGESKGVAPMWVGSGSGGQDGSSSLLEPKDHLNVFPEVAFEPGDAVEVTTLADWANRERIERIDGMWLDLQGYELAALRGAGDLIGRLSALILEISAQELYAAAPLWPEVRAWLETAGFEIVAEHWHHSGASGDALAVRRPSARAATASY